MSTAVLDHPLLKRLSLRSLPGSVLGALVIHAALYGSVILILGTGVLKHTEQPMDDSEIGYEILNDVPVASEKVARVVRQREETPIVPKEKSEATARELQDEKSDVTGTSQASVQRPSQIGSEGDGSANSTPFYKIKPKYPRAALISGAEGWILLKIDVNEKGEVENVRIVGGERRNMFEMEAKRAVEKWKYRPFKDANGNILRKADHQVRVDFKLTDANT
jgi:TonB family protein